MPIEFTRRSTSKEVLRLDWDYPVAKKFAANAGDGKTTSARMAEYALPVADVYKILSGDDRRPLLVLRECDKCKGSDVALLSRSLGDERTKLLANWFHCVKLPPDVLRKNHPFSKLYPEQDKVPHLFFSSYDGKGRVTLGGDQKQADLWKVMTKAIEDNYQKSPKPALKAMVSLLSQFDSFDILEEDYKKMLRDEMYKSGGKSTKADKLRAKIAEVQKKKASAMKRAKAVCDLKLVVSK
ncbi:MAG: hypothetical protein KDC87_08000 [Planctomycetes bacterium]|nr:hypothetical protein [Planctomycetota bacterium]MCB9871050.1 hypothetical protein [Planctomycetota bacterium]